MAIREFQGVQTVGAASQPVFGTTLTAASIFATDRFTGTNRPGTTTPPVPLVVASTLGMNVGDRVLIGLKANFTRANYNLLDQGTVASIADATHLTVQGLTQNHAVGEYLVLNECASKVDVIPVSINAAMYLGKSSTVSPTDSSVFAGGSPQYWANNPTTATGDSYQTSEFWIYGAAGDTFIGRFDQI